MPKIYISTRFHKIPQLFIEVQKKNKIEIMKKEVCPKYVVKTLYGRKFSVS